MTVSDMMSTMTITDFEERAMAYGGNIDGWPDEDQAAARALLARSPAARVALEEARSLDAMLDLWEGPQPSNALLGRVLADAASVAGEVQAARAVVTARPVRAGWIERLFGNGAILRSGMALAACLALGFVMGTTIEQDMLPPVAVDTAQVEIGVIDFAFAMEDDADLLLGPEAFL